MANRDDELSLPEPPPPAPARREAAIEEALRRFDGGEKSAGPRPSHTEPRRSGFRWGISNRPQLGILAAASLVAVIGLPLAWQTATQRTKPAAEMASRENLKTFDVQEEPPPPAVAFEPKQAASPPLAAQENEAPQAMASVQTVDTAKSESATRLAKASAVPASPARESRPDIVQSPVVVAPAISVAAPPPMIHAEAPPAAESRGELADARDVIVTAAKRRGRSAPDRGDWNACTIDDPRHNLAACKSLVNPGAKGIKGQAAAHLADGLSLAWQGNTDRAIAAFDQALAIDPKSALAYLNRGLAWQRKGDESRALADLDQSVKLAPHAPRGYYNRSLLQRERGDERKAKADQARAIDLDPDYQAVID